MSRHVHGFGETDPKSLVAAGYDQVATSYAGLEGAAGCPRLRWLREVLNSLPDGAVVLDLGCGSGDPAGTEIVKRYRLTGVDVSPAHIELARENAPDGDFVCASAIDVELPPESFDAVVSFYTIDHIPRVEHEELFRKLNTWLRPRGVLLLSVEDCDQPDAVGQWLGVEMFGEEELTPCA